MPIDSARLGRRSRWRFRQILVLISSPLYTPIRTLLWIRPTIPIFRSMPRGFSPGFRFVQQHNSLQEVAAEVLVAGLAVARREDLDLEPVRPRQQPRAAVER